MKALKITLGAVAAILVAVCAIWNGELRSLCNVRQVRPEDPYLFEMDYKASYDLDKVLAAGIDSNNKLVEFVIGQLSRGLYKPTLDEKGIGNGYAQAAGTNGISFACTSFQAKNSESDGYLFGRNYDFFKNPTLVLRSSPRGGYKSLSTCDLSHLGYDLEKLPVSAVKKALCLAAVYAPMDGMNEKGLCISIMALPDQPAWQDTGKPIVGTSILMRLILDRCATVGETLELLQSVDVRHDRTKGGGYHYLVADASGSCAAIEFDLHDGWKSMILQKPEGRNHMLMTNHLLNPKYYTETPDPEVGNVHSRSWWRYSVASEYLGSREGKVSPAQAAECLSLVHWKDFLWDNGEIVEDTQWSNVYDQSALTLTLRDWHSYETPVNFAL